jgi:hypothetical protein
MMYGVMYAPRQQEKKDPAAGIRGPAGGAGFPKGRTKGPAPLFMPSQVASTERGANAS